MAWAKKYEIGQVFKSTRFDSDNFLIVDIIEQTKETKQKKTSVTGSSYLLSYIPEVTENVMPSGRVWVHKREPFQSNDEIIDREIKLGNIEVVE